MDSFDVVQYGRLLLLLLALLHCILALLLLKVAVSQAIKHRHSVHRIPAAANGNCIYTLASLRAGHAPQLCLPRRGCFIFAVVPPLLITTPKA